MREQTIFAPMPRRVWSDMLAAGSIYLARQPRRAKMWSITILFEFLLGGFLVGGALGVAECAALFRPTKTPGGAGRIARLFDRHRLGDQSGLVRVEGQAGSPTPSKRACCARSSSRKSGSAVRRPLLSGIENKPAGQCRSSVQPG